MANQYSPLRQGSIRRGLSRIDLVYYGTDQRQLEYDFVVSPGADPKAIQLAVEGAEEIRVEATATWWSKPKAARFASTCRWCTRSRQGTVSTVPNNHPYQPIPSGLSP